MLSRLVEHGLHDIVLAPGSRSQALALVAAALERRGDIRLHVRIDERVAAFTALGLARESRRPVAVICTSGTAVGNLMPAVMEAHHSGVPLLVLTADRPPELRGVGANQTTIQPGVFGPLVRFAIDAPVPAFVERQETAEPEDGDPADPGLRNSEVPPYPGSAASPSVVDSDRQAASADHGDLVVTDLTGIADAAFAAAAGAGGRAPGPVHVNLPFREPLAGAAPAWLAEDGPVSPRASGSDSREVSGALYQGGGGVGEVAAATEGTAPLDVHDLTRGPRTIVVAGADAGPAAEQLAHEAGWPLVAEIVSGARFGRRLVHGYRALLREPALGGEVERVVVYGRPTLSREVAALLSRPDVSVIAVRGTAEPVNLNGATLLADAVRVVEPEPGPEAEREDAREWLGRWMRASRDAEVDLAPPAPDAAALASAEPATRLGAISAEVQAFRLPLDRRALVDAVWRATWPHDRLVFGSSRLVRVADEILGGKRVPVHANRGVAGIDGTIAAATGIAIASQAGGGPGVTRLVLGDLAALHDVGAMLLPPHEPEPRVQVIVGNDRGGTIFDGLEVAAVASRDDLDRVLYTPHSVRFEQLALAYGWEYHRPTTRSALDQLLTSPVGGRQLIEVPLER